MSNSAFRTAALVLGSIMITSLGMARVEPLVPQQVKPAWQIANDPVKAPRTDSIVKTVSAGSDQHPFLTEFLGPAVKDQVADKPARKSTKRAE
jgi:hypothetical protein